MTPITRHSQLPLPCCHLHPPLSSPHAAALASRPRFTQSLRLAIDRTDGPVVGRGLIFARTRVQIQVSAYLFEFTQKKNIAEGRLTSLQHGPRGRGIVEALQPVKLLPPCPVSLLQPPVPPPPAPAPRKRKSPPPRFPVQGLGRFGWKRPCISASSSSTSSPHRKRQPPAPLDQPHPKDSPLALCTQLHVL